MTEVKERSKRKEKIGIVVSTAMNKSIVIKVERFHIHPIYKKRIKKVTKIMAHDENNTCVVGDEVRITECRPLSKRKAWRIVEIIKKAI